jgi:DNA-binding Lrp family transcriptional regulator
LVRVKEQDMKLLFELIKGARRSDRELARITGVSQPTITRTRTRLEKEGFIREYTIIPDLKKMGYELFAFTFLSFAEDRQDLFDKAREWTRKQPCVIFANQGEGLGKNSIMLSLHRNYAGYTKLISLLRQDWQPNLTGEQSFIISLDRADLMIKQFSFRYLKSDE